MTNRFKILAALLALFTLASACEKLPTLTEEEMEAEDERMGQERYAVMRMLRNLADVQFDSEFDDDIDFEEMSLEPTIASSLQAMTFPSGSITPTVLSVASFICTITL